MGVGPMRYVPYVREQRPTNHDAISTFASISDASEDDLDNTIVPQRQESTGAHASSSEAATIEHLQQLTDSVPTQIETPRPVDRPPPDSQQDRFLPGSSGLSQPRTMPQSICQLTDVPRLLLATEPPPIESGSATPTGRAAEAIRAQLETRSTIATQPPSSRFESRRSRSLVGLPPMLSMPLPSCQRPIAPDQISRLVNARTLALSSGSPDIRDQSRTTNREMSIMRQMEELDRELRELRAPSGTNGTRSSSDFHGFTPINEFRQANPTPTQSEAYLGAQTFTVQADVHTAPILSPSAETSSIQQGQQIQAAHVPAAMQSTSYLRQVQAGYDSTPRHSAVAVRTLQSHPPVDYTLAIPEDQLYTRRTPQLATAVHLQQRSRMITPQMHHLPPLHPHLANAVCADSQHRAQQLLPPPAEATRFSPHNYYDHAPSQVNLARSFQQHPIQEMPAYPAFAHAQLPPRSAVVQPTATFAPQLYGPSVARTYAEGANRDGYGHAPGQQQHTFRDTSGHRLAVARKVMELPQFGGAPEDWPQFISAYETSTREYGYSNLENMGRIQRALTGEAKRRLRGILIRPEHVERSVAILARTFGRPHILAESQLREVRKIPKIADNRPHDIVNFSTSIESLVSLLDAPDTEHLLTDYLLMKELTSKLPLYDQRVWAAVARYIGPNPSIRDFAKWLSEVADDISNIRSDAAEGPVMRSRDPRPTQTRPFPTHGRHILLNVTNNSSRLVCTFCGEDHECQSCNAFKRLSAVERLIEVRKRPLCFFCLSADHILPACDRKRECGIGGCKRYHHALLHQEGNRTEQRPLRQNLVINRAAEPQRRRQNTSRPPADAMREAVSNPSNPEIDACRASTVLNCQGTRAKPKLFYRVVPVVLYGPGKEIRTHALFDEGSSVSLIDTDLADQLQLPGETRKLDLVFVNGASSTHQSRSVSVGISGTRAGDIRFDIATVQTASGISLPAQTVDREDVLEKNPHLAEVPFESFVNAKPKILLGLEHHFLGVPLATRMGKDVHSIAAAQTRLGWVLYGCSDHSILPGAVVLHAREFGAEQNEEVVQLQQLHEIVRRHFTTEEFGVKVPTEPIQSDRDKRALAILNSTTKRIGGRFETGLLWKQDDIVLPDSYPMALNRLKSVEAKMRRDPGYAAQYNEQIRAYLVKGYARQMTVAEASHRSPRTWYLPHFAVQSAAKPGKFRIVFDAAATTHNVSLNEMLLPGPDLNTPLTRILFRFRLGAVGVCADVREMFHQVMVRCEDQDAQRFLWRGGDTTAEPKTYVMTAMTFGSTCSPTSAQFVKNRNAQEHAGRYPEAAEAIQRSHYVDDYVASFRTAADAVRITDNVIKVHERGGFQLRGVVSNCPDVRKRFGADAADNRSISFEPEDLTQKILGMTWETEHDSFSFATRFHRVHPGVIDGSRVPTKREILSVVMSIFDPFGLLANFLLPSKVIIQDLWRLGVQWDESVPDEINARWQSWRKEIVKTKRVRIARCYSPAILLAPGLQLHVFADASEEAYAAVAYWRINGVDGPEISFVAGKARCSPLKILSIPRLELQAAVLATRLMNEITESHDILNIAKVTFWSDSETILKWLRCDQRRYVQFVAHRVAEIVERAPAEWWRYVPTALNVADDATRVHTPVEFDPESRWLHGPAWLKMDEENWPAQPDFANLASATVEELRPKFVGAVSTRGAVDFDRFSNFSRLVSCVGWMKRFIHNARGEHMVGGLTTSELDRATLAICRWVQEESFRDDLADLRAGQPIDKKSSLFILKPYVDDEGVMRVHGRTDAARIEFMPIGMKRPIIMPHKHLVTHLIVRHHHEQNAHQLVNATISAIRQKYWVPRIRSVVKSVQRACMVCRIRAARPQPPSQGQLPTDRLEAYVRPFTHTGLDFFGPYHVSIGRRREKRWVALFTCMAVRAVHLEVAADLSTDACLLCIRNFCHLRGVPSRIRCDNGTNFVGAKNELDRQPGFFDPDTVQKELAAKGVEWTFNCPGNPEAGGAWERLVQAVKRVLSVVLKEEAPRIETFRSLLLEAANVVNSRPLTHLQVTPEDPEPITPNHFLLGGPNVATAPRADEVEPKATRKQWQICRGLARRFWSVFVRDYLPELTRRSKHYGDHPKLSVGDLVVICDEQQPKGRWSRGIITEVAEAADGVVRTATVRTASGNTYRRPAARLAKVDIGPSGGGDVRGAVSRSGAGGQ